MHGYLRSKVLSQGLRSRAMPKFHFLIGMILFWYCVDVSMHGASDKLEIKRR